MNQEPRKYSSQNPNYKEELKKWADTLRSFNSFLLLLSSIVEFRLKYLVSTVFQNDIVERRLKIGKRPLLGARTLLHNSEQINNLQGF